MEMPSGMASEFQALLFQFLKSQKESETPDDRPNPDGSGRRPQNRPHQDEGPVEAPRSKVPKLDLAKDPVIISMQSHINTVDSKLDLILSRLGTLQPEVPVPGPASVSASVLPLPQDQSLLCSDDPVDDDHDLSSDWAEPSPFSRESLSRAAARKIWLTGLAEVCPDLPERKVQSPQRPSTHFKCLKKKKEDNFMPFIGCQK